ncbi:MAG: NAD(P)H-dependent oxidoreductase subunit E, partial [Anaerolineae bacterium]|nr:NAD(P)H-dependent oxidoreductase subunit E [Anaerolineae bacterium]
FGVATFYHLFTLTPPGRHSCVVCTGTACHIRGADKILCAIESAFSLQPGDTTPDGAATLNIARCLSFCGPAPVVEFDAVAHGNVTPDAAVDQIRGWINHDA